MLRGALAKFGMIGGRGCVTEGAGKHTLSPA